MNEKISTKPLEKALRSLQESIVVAKEFIQDTKTSNALKNTLMAGVIQHFEFSYELSVTTLKRTLKRTMLAPELINTMSYKAIIREGAVHGFIDNVTPWFQYRDKRNLTSHTYDPSTAEDVYESACEFYNDGLALLHKLQDTSND